MKQTIALLIMLCVMPVVVLAQSANSNVNTTTAAVSSPSQTLTIEASNPNPGMGRYFTPPVQPYEAPVLPYFGPWTTGSNILDDLRTLPQEFTLVVAKSMYKGGVKVRVNVLYDPPANVKGSCKLLYALPSKPLLGTDGKQVVNSKGEPLFVLDEDKFRRAAYIFLQGDKNADTADVIAKAVIEAMKLGANAIVVVKKVTLTSVSSSGWGVGAGAVQGMLTGPGLDKAQSYSAGTGYNRANTKPMYREGLVVLAVRE